VGLLKTRSDGPCCGLGLDGVTGVQAQVCSPVLSFLTAGASVKNFLCAVLLCSSLSASAAEYRCTVEKKVDADRGLSLSRREAAALGASKVLGA
jgi:hypothetical protein